MTVPEGGGREQAARDRGEELLQALRKLRFAGFAVPGHDAAPPEVHAALIGLRERLDLAQPLIDECARIRDECALRAARLKAAADDAYDAELDRLSRRAVTREYESIQDRTVQARVKALPQRREAREAERVAEITASCDRAAGRVAWEMRGVREELLVRLRSYLPLMAALES